LTWREIDMTALLGILAYIAAVAGLAVVYWILQKRTGEDESRSVSPPPQKIPSPPTPPIVPSSQALQPATPAGDSGEFALGKVPAVPLEKAIATWGELGQAFRIPQLARFAIHADSNVRAAVAVALGNIALKQRGAGMERVVPVLGKLSKDTNQQVRLGAIAALGNIRSATVLPWLQQALRSPDAETTKAASLALQRSRLSETPKPAKPARVPLQRRK
jgi:hypothetical protein